MTAQDTIARRDHLRRSGYSPIPVEGKRPVLKAWDKHTETNFDEITLWSKVYATAGNTGILTRLTPTIDIDIKNPEAAAAIEDLARERFEERGFFLVRIGEAPKRAVLLRTDQPFAKITANLTALDGATEKIELLCDGQQVVCFGIHPGTGQPYTWHGGQPGDIAWEELPYVRREDALAFVEAAREVLVTDFGYVHADERPRQLKGSAKEKGCDNATFKPEPVDRDKIKAALAVIDSGSYDTWLHVGAALRDEFGKSGFEMFDAWSARSPKYQPDECKKKWRDVRDLREFTAGTILYLADQADPGWRDRYAEGDEKGNGAGLDPGARPVIRLEAGKYHEIAEAAEIAILAAGLPLFDRGGTLTMPVVAEARGADGQKTKTVALMQVTEPQAREFMGRAAVFEQFDRRSKAWVKTKPPRDIAELMLVRRGRWPFPQIHGVLAAPTLRPDGSLLAAEGFDPATGLYVLNPPDTPAIAEQPTRADAEAAHNLLDELLDEFPWCDKASRAVAMSGLITPIARAAFPTAPLHAFTAPAAGTGKSYVADLASAIATGFACSVQAQGGNEEEDEKRIAATLIAGYPILSIDNCTKPLRGAALCQLVERPMVEVRLLGKSMKLRIEPRVTVFATGNNLTIAEDLTRRVIVARLDAQMEQPHLREFRKYPLAMIMAGRGKYIAAALTIVRAYQVAGRPDRLPSFGSFDGWSNCVRSALAWLGCADPVTTTDAAHRNDPYRQQAGALFEAWVKAYGLDTEKRAAEVVGTTDPDLREALLDVAGIKNDVNVQKLGIWLRDHADYIVDGRRLERRGTTTRPAWRIAESSKVWGS